MGLAMKRGQAWWDQHWLKIAKDIAEASKDPSTQTGTLVIGLRNEIVTSGYNGFPGPIADDDRLNIRELKYDIIVHSEMNALIFAKNPIRGCTVYVWPFMMCSRCASVMIQAGIRRHVAPNNPDPRWAKSFELSKQLFSEAMVE